MTIGSIVTSLIVIALATFLLIPKNTINTSQPEKIVYLEKECQPRLCEQQSFQPIITTPTSSDNTLNAKVFGTLYADNDLAVIFGSCSDSFNHPSETNATLTIYFQNTSIYVNQSNMTKIDTGRFNYSTNITANRGNYLIMLNCTQGNTYAVAYAEFQNPSWINNMADKLNNIIGATNKKDFEIDKLTVVSPIYPNETIFVEATFSDENGTITTPDSINLTIFYPNRTLFVAKTKTDFAQVGYVWNYSEVTVANQKTGTYFVHLSANDTNGKRAVKTAQFRIATGGPYRVSIECPSSVIQGERLYCTVKITDEGEIATESTTTVWIDANGNSITDIDEIQTSFSKKTTPQQFVTENIGLDIPSTMSEKLYIVRLKTTYLGSTQPDSTASDTIAVLAKTSAISLGGGGGIADTKCLPYAVQFRQCYTYDIDEHRCQEGCSQNKTCDKNRLVCIPSNTTLQSPPSLVITPILRLSWLDKVKLWLSNVFSSKAPTLGIKPIVKEKEIPIFQTYANVAIISISGLLLFLAFWTYGTLIFTTPIGITGVIFLLMIVYTLTHFKVFG